MRSIRRDGATAAPELWFEINPEGWSYGCGFWAATPTMMAAMRREIDENPEKMRKLARKFKQQDIFVLDGEDYKRPKMDPGNELAAWYNKKNIVIRCDRPFDDTLCSAELTDTIFDGFVLLKPYYDFFESFCMGGLEDLK